MLNQSEKKQIIEAVEKGNTRNISTPKPAVIKAPIKVQKDSSK